MCPRLCCAFYLSMTETRVGTHDDAIRCVEYSSDVNVVVTGSWDSTVKMWDPRTPCNAGSFAQPERVYTMSLCGDKLVVGTAGRKILVWDLRNMGYVQQRRESSLKYQTRCIRCFPNKQGYVLSSIEGSTTCIALFLRYFLRQYGLCLLVTSVRNPIGCSV